MLVVLVWGMALVVASSAQAQIYRGKLVIRTVDSETDQPVAARIQITNEHSVKVRPPGLFTDGAWTYIDGEAPIELRPGTYSFVLERGLEYKIRTGHFTIERRDDDVTEFDMIRFVDMSQDGWYSGDLNLQKSSSQIDLMMRADDLHIAPLVGELARSPSPTTPRWQAGPMQSIQQNRLLGQLGATSDRAFPGMTLFALQPPMDLQAAEAFFPASIGELRAAHQSGAVHIDLHHAAVEELPIWVAAGMVDSVGLLSDQLQPEGATDWDQAPARLRRPERIAYPMPQGQARWAEQIYYHLLNCGLRIAPTAGSGAGAEGGPATVPGYNRTYVYCEEPFSYQAWWEGLRAGQVMVTNGPLITPEVRNSPPGHVFYGEKGQSVELQIGLTLRTREPIEYLEIIQNGISVEQVRLDEYKARRGRLTPVVFERSGWFLVRAVAENPLTYRAATTAPYYVQIGDTPRISRESVQFFLDWIDERAEALQTAPSETNAAERRNATLRVYAQAREYWQDLLEKANAP